ncbi:hypothetical protein MVES1_002542 [Malassezia vespertilionis]|uniref:MPN domain-containing protein n=1 Tax=Malassezia vespertilionis TaxID=2020962 RepID=A0A2N1JAA8_9BASI|nr:uncharacterized protein MVES1_002542 [Malassezia vespertilionis]PKI83463.1 hypothetical protein MVES_002401 [Malassezia vespertilionis]WFD07183.1 hypothetical protein MVES1_002542 [Malassezia vespertilionis]
MAPEVKHAELSKRAYHKIAMHASKYPASTVIGVLVGLPGSTCVVADVIPVAHLWTELSPMTETALALIDAHLQNKPDQVIGVYQVPARMDVKEPTHTTARLAKKIAQKSEHDALVLQVHGHMLLAPQLSSLSPFVKKAESDAPKALAAQAASVPTYADLLPSLEKNIADGHWKLLADFDDHLEDPALEWLENPVFT